VTHPWIYRPRTTLPDGVYQVDQRAFVAGFVVSRGHVVRCAPILRKWIGYWCEHATRLGP
jgi:hypothetical protein